MLMTWRIDDAVYALMSDVVDPACITGRLLGQGVRIDLGVTIVDDIELPTFTEISTVTTLPHEAVVGQTVYRVTLPSDLADGDYALVLHDHCLSVTTPLLSFQVPPAP
jgi:hypothetical protein